MTDKIAIDRSVVEQALEDLEMTINYVQSPTRREDMRDSIEALRAALEQPQDHHEQLLTMVPAGWKLAPSTLTDAQPRQPLTVGQINRLIADGKLPLSGNPYEVARAIERAHGIGGDA